MGYIYIPVIQQECDIFVEYWNSHRLRKQKGLQLPTGIPNHMFEFPENYGGRKAGNNLTRTQLQDVANLSGICDAPTDFIDDDIKEQFRQHVPRPDLIESKNASNAYQFLKSMVTNN